MQACTIHSSNYDETLFGVSSQGLSPVGATGGRPVREQNQHSRQSWVRENKASPFWALPRIQWFAWATAGRPYSGHRDHQGCPFAPGIRRYLRTGRTQRAPL